MTLIKNSIHSNREDETRPPFRFAQSNEGKPNRVRFWLLNRIAKKHGCEILISKKSTRRIAIISHQSFIVEAELSFLSNLARSIFSVDPEMFIGEGFMHQKWWMVEGKLEDFLAFLWNVTESLKLLSFARRFLNRKRFSFWQKNDPLLSKNNIAHHYDNQNPDNQLFKSMLGDIPCYSAGIYQNHDTKLAIAQKTKIDKIIELIKPKPNQKALDIGSGWAVLTERLHAEKCEITGITLSEEQLNYCNKKFKNETKITHKLKDYRDFFAENCNKFDIITCIEVLDHIGLNQFDSFFEVVNNNLNDRGVFFIQLIARPKPGQTSGWIQKYIYPGGYIASFEEVQSSYQKFGFTAEKIQYIDGFHYAQTLRDWRTNFQNNWKKIENTNKFNNIFFNKWMFFFAYSIAAFDNANFHNYHILLRKN